VKTLIAAIVCVGVLYVTDTQFFQGKYFGALFQIASRVAPR
jgi:hypothetical protein